MRPNRLFMVAPSEIFEHPPTLSVLKSRISDGPIVGYEAYAPRWSGGGSETIGPFEAIVISKYDDLCIAVYDGGRLESEYWYRGGKNEGGTYDRPCWYQSGSTLRFIAKREEPRT
jgi:hypothetical protein